MTGGMFGKCLVQQATRGWSKKEGYKRRRRVQVKRRKTKRGTHAAYSQRVTNDGIWKSKAKCEVALCGNRLGNTSEASN